MKSLCNRIVLFSALAVTGMKAMAVNADSIPYPIEPALTVELVLNQQEIAVEVPASAAMPGYLGFGLIGMAVGMAIDNANQKNAEERVSDIRNMLLDYDFNQAFEDAAKVVIASPGISSKPILVTRKTAWDAVAQMGEPMAGPQQTVLRLVPRYAIASNFESLSVNMQAMYVQRTVKESGKIKESSIFTRTYTYELPLEKKAGSGAEEDADRWVAMGKERLSALLSQGIQQVNDMFAYDFSTEGREKAKESTRGRQTNFKGQTYNGTLLRQTDDYIWVANGKNATRSIKGIYPLSDAVIEVSSSEAPAGTSVEASVESPTLK